MKPTLVSPPNSEEDAWRAQAIANQNAIRAERKTAVQAGLPALDRLAQVLTGRSGQSYKLRALLYSLWNGKPASLVEIVNLDWEIRRDLCAALLGFGYEEKGPDNRWHGLFYRAVETAIRAVGQWDWFLEERENIQSLEEYCHSVRRP